METSVNQLSGSTLPLLLRDTKLLLWRDCHRNNDDLLKQILLILNDEQLLWCAVAKDPIGRRMNTIIDPTKANLWSTIEYNLGRTSHANLRIKKRMQQQLSSSDIVIAIEGTMANGTTDDFEAHQQQYNNDCHFLYKCTILECSTPSQSFDARSSR